MNTIDNAPTYNLKAVVQETGLKADTLRAWERRYNLPSPQRTPSGHRLYSDRDIEILKWLVLRQEEGLSISRAVALWRRLESEHPDPLKVPMQSSSQTTSHRGEAYANEPFALGQEQVGSEPRRSDHTDARGVSFSPTGHSGGHPGGQSSQRFDENSLQTGTQPTMPTYGQGQSGAYNTGVYNGGAYTSSHNATNYAQHGVNDTLSILRNDWVNHCLNFAEQDAERVLSEAFSMFSIEVVCIEVLQKGMSMIGDGWYQGRITVHQEHFASALALRRIETLMSTTPPPTRPGRIAVGCPAGEEHTFIPLVISLLLRRKGWDVLYLNGNIPLRSLETTMKTARPHLMILTAQQLYTASSLLDTARFLFAENVPVAFGGRIFLRVPNLHESIPGYYLGKDLDEAIQIIESKISIVSSPPKAMREVSREYIDAHNHYRERQARIEADVWRNTELLGIPQNILAEANISLGRNITAALNLGNMNYLGPDLEWIESLLVNHYQMPAHIVNVYIQLYYKACQKHLSDAGMIVTGWLSQTLGVQTERLKQGSQTSVNQAAINRTKQMA
ncbi:MAG: MerR family transcriptional regulator [Chloroflexota bacterium]